MRARVRLGPAQRTVCSTLFSIILFACVLSWSSTECSAYENTHTYRKRDIYIYIHVCICIHKYVCVHACLLYVYFCCFDLIGAKDCAIVRCVSCFWNNIENNRPKKKNPHLKYLCNNF